MLKLIGAFCFVIAGAVYGSFKSESLKLRHVCCSEIHEMLTQISIMIRFRNLNVYEIVDSLKSSEMFCNLKFIDKLPSHYEPDDNFHQQWCSAVNHDVSIGDEEKSVLCSFGAVFGTSDIEGQVKSIDGAIENVHSIMDKRLDEYVRKGKLYRSLGMLVGVMAGILLI